MHAFVSKAKMMIDEPGKYGSLAGKLLLQKLCPIFRRASFFLQGQMDINRASRWYNPEFVEQTGGYFPQYNDQKREVLELDAWDTTRRDMLILLLRQIVDRDVQGDFVELGVYQGRTARLIHHYAPERKLHLFDTFDGFTQKGADAELVSTGKRVSQKHFSDTSLERVREYVAQKNDNVRYYGGYFPESVPDDIRTQTFAFVHLDADLYEPTLAGLELFYPLATAGAIFVIHDYNAWPGARKAVDEFFMDKRETPIPMPDKSGSVVIVKIG